MTPTTSAFAGDFSSSEKELLSLYTILVSGFFPSFLRLNATKTTRWRPREG
jgi:hypothetical protein